MNDNIINITTYEQLKYHLLNGEVAVIPRGKKIKCTVFFRKIDDRYSEYEDDEVEVIIQPLFGDATYFTGKFDERLEGLFNAFIDSGVKIIVVKGEPMRMRRLNIIDKIFNFFRSKIKY